MLRTRHGASQPVTPSAAYASEAEPPPATHYHFNHCTSPPAFSRKIPPISSLLNLLTGYMDGRQYNNYCTMFGKVLQPEVISCLKMHNGRLRPDSSRIRGGGAYSAPKTF